MSESAVPPWGIAGSMYSPFAGLSSVCCTIQVLFLQCNAVHNSGHSINQKCSFALPSTIYPPKYAIFQTQKKQNFFYAMIGFFLYRFWGPSDCSGAAVLPCPSMQGIIICHGLVAVRAKRLGERWSFVRPQSRRLHIEGGLFERLLVVVVGLLRSLLRSDSGYSLHGGVAVK